ncbi:MAG TPA: hypothetical protein VFD41_10320, partial [Actinomycetales bacterium]|nr:hypothetical protein [Actinomycetales bacterium]
PRVGVQTLLVGLGALLLAVAAVVFLAFSWDVLSLTGRAVVIAATTIAVLAGAALARRKQLDATAEAVAAVGVVLVLLDAGAVHATGLFGADDVPTLSFAASSAAVVAAALATVGLRFRLRAASVAAAVLAPLAPVLAGAAAADGGAGARAFAAGLAAALAVTSLRGLAPDRLAAERRTLSGAAVLTVAVAVPTLAVVALDDGAGVAAWLTLALAVAVAAQTVAAGRRGAWAVAAGTLTAGAVTLAVTTADLGPWLVGAAPVAVAAAVLALVLVARAPGVVGRTASPLADRAALGAAAVGLLALLPAAALVGYVVLTTPVLAARQPWSAGAGDSLAAVVGIGGDPARLSDVLLASVCALVVVAGATTAAGRVTGVRRLAVPAPWLLAAAAAALPLQPAAPVALVVATGAVLAVAAGVASVTVAAPWRTSALALAGVAGTSSVLIAWTVPDLALPATLLGAGALLAARRIGGPLRPLRPLLSAAATAAALVDVAAASHRFGLDLPEATLVAAVAGALAVVAAVTVPRSQVDPAERRAVLVPGLLACAVGVGVAGTPATGDARPVVALAAALVAALALAVATGLSAAERSVAAAASPVLALLLALAAAGAWTALDPVLVASAVTATTACAAAALGRRGDHRRPAVEVSAAGLAVLTGAWLLSDAGAAGAVLPLVVLAVAALVVAGLPDRRPLAWVALALGALAWWLRLGVADVRAVEVYTLPVAAVLLTVAVLGTVRHGSDGRPRPAALTGAALAVLPSTVAGVTGDPWRLAATAAVAVLALGGAVAVRGAAPAWRSWAPVLAGAACLVAVVGVLPRALLAAWTARTGGEVPSWSVELWAVVAAALVLGAGLVVARFRAEAPSVALVVGALPSLVAVTADASGLARSLGVLAVGGALVLARPGGGLGVAGRWTAVAAALWGLVLDVAGPTEVLTVPLAALLLAEGWRSMRAAGSSAADLPSSAPLAPGLAVLLLPSLLLATLADDVWRLVGLATAATVSVLLGARHRWAAPLLGGAGVLAVHAVVQLAPVAAVAYRALPRWVTLAVAGALLLALGARYESRLADLRSVRNRISDLR